ncbi:MAG: fumarylacetoacetate hydrolase family protein [Burkholderiales bacterium]|nr:fumarylacetoacetate hydrolase family protein [Burkholderiales bacterium]
MRVVSYRSLGSSGLGVLDGDQVIDVGAAAPRLPDDLGAVLAMPNGLAALSEVQKARSARRLPLDAVELDLPVTAPRKIVCLGLNYADHAAEGGHAAPDYPALFMRALTSLAPHGAPLVRPRCSEKLDYEAELLVVIGTGGRHIPKARALEHVAGYSCFNDGSVRDYQRKSTQWTIGKNFDATGGVGPWFVSADELPPGAKGLRIRSRLNGTVMQDSNTKRMIFDVATTIATLSEAMTLEPGDLIAMGTPAGVGNARKPPVYMEPGDVVEIEIEGIGVLRNPIVAEGAARAAIPEATKAV